MPDRFRSFLLPLLMILLLVDLDSCAPKPRAVVFTNGIIHLLDSADTVCEAMAVADGRIVALGSELSVRSRCIPDTVIDLGAAHVFPGFIDAHAHLFGIGEERLILDLRGMASPETVADAVARAARESVPGAWIRGRGWDQNLWERKSFPDRSPLDRACPGRPVFLKRVDGHAAWVNTLALERAGIDAGTPDPPGGKILRGRDGSPTGILIDNAVDLISTIVPQPDQAELENIYSRAIRHCLSVGLTGMHDMGITGDRIRAVRSLIEKKGFPFRVAAYIDGPMQDWDDLLTANDRTFGSHQLVLAGLKLYADGALGSRGAQLLAAYSDDPDNSGIEISSEDTIAFHAGRALGADLQVCVHAIGDLANRRVLNAYERVLRSTGLEAGKRLRVEHVQVLSESDIPRFHALGVIPSMQPTHCTSDMPWAETRLGAQRIRHAYCWRDLIAAGSWIPGGSDSPVEKPDPLLGIYAACTRRDPEGKPSSQSDIDAYFRLAADAQPDADRYRDGWYGGQKMTRREAIDGFTINAATAARMEDLVGSLSVGKYADFVLLSKDVSRVPAADLLRTEVLATYVGGQQAYARGE